MDFLYQTTRSIATIIKYISTFSGVQSEHIAFIHHRKKIHSDLKFLCEHGNLDEPSKQKLKDIFNGIVESDNIIIDNISEAVYQLKED